MLNLRKKTAASLAGITIGALCLWGVSLWQNVSREELLAILLGTVLMITAIIVGAALLILIFKGISRLFSLIGKSSNRD